MRAHICATATLARVAQSVVTGCRDERLTERFAPSAAMAFPDTDETFVREVVVAHKRRPYRCVDSARTG